MTIESQIKSKVSSYQQKSRNLDGKDELDRMIRIIFGECCNCPHRFFCIKSFFQIMHISKEDLIAGALEVKDNCKTKFTWKYNPGEKKC